MDNFFDRNGNFSVRRQPGFFNALPSDQVIEQTINRGQKCRGGISGYSTSAGTVQRWVLTSHCVAKAMHKMECMMDIDDGLSVTKDVGSAIMLFDEGAVGRAFDILSTWGNPLFPSDSLVNIASGLEATPEVRQDLLQAKSKGASALDTFLEQRIKTNDVPFYDAIKRCKLKTFSSLKVKKVCKVKEKAITIRAERAIFANLLVIGEKRDTVSMKDLLTYSLGPIPWSLALPDGGLVKTVKSKLINAVEADVPAIENLPYETVFIFDGMVLLQQLDAIRLDTFGEISDHIFSRITKGNARTIYFVTDQYYPHSVKGMERTRRASSGTIRVKLDRREQKKPKQFKKYLSDPVNKIELVKFLLADWSHPTRFKEKINNRKIYVTVEERCQVIHVQDGEVQSYETEELFSLVEL